MKKRWKKQWDEKRKGRLVLQNPKESRREEKHRKEQHREDHNFDLGIQV